MDQWQYLHQARQLQQAPQPGYGQQTFQDNKRTSPRANTGTVDPQLLQASISVAPLSASPKGLTSYSSPSFITPPQVQPASNLRGSDFLYSAPGNFGYHSPYSPNMVTTQNMSTTGAHTRNPSNIQQPQAITRQEARQAPNYFQSSPSPNSTPLDRVGYHTPGPLPTQGLLQSNIQQPVFPTNPVMHNRARVTSTQQNARDASPRMLEQAQALVGASGAPAIRGRSSPITSTGMPTINQFGPSHPSISHTQGISRNLNQMQSVNCEVPARQYQQIQKPQQTRHSLHLPPNPAENQSLRRKSPQNGAQQAQQSYIPRHNPIHQPQPLPPHAAPNNSPLVQQTQAKPSSDRTVQVRQEHKTNNSHHGHTQATVVPKQHCNEPPARGVKRPSDGAIIEHKSASKKQVTDSMVSTSAMGRQQTLQGAIPMPAISGTLDVRAKFEQQRKLHEEEMKLREKQRVAQEQQRKLHEERLKIQERQRIAREQQKAQQLRLQQEQALANELAEQARVHEQIRIEKEYKIQRKEQLRKDPTALYRHYLEYMEFFPPGPGQYRNQYLGSLLANRSMPLDLESDQAMAITFAKEHWSCFYSSPKDTAYCAKKQREVLAKQSATAASTNPAQGK